jgi:hypothetical protein
MTYSFPALSRRRIAAILFGAATFVLVGCQSTGFGTNPSAVGAFSKDLTHLSTPATPSYTWYKYDYSGAANTVVTGISADTSRNSSGGSTSTIVKSRFVGVTYPNSGTPYESFIVGLTDSTITSGPDNDPPNNSNVYVSALNHGIDGATSALKNYSVGYIVNGTSNNCQSTKTVVACGLVYDPDKGETLRLQDSNQGKHACAATYLYGTSDPDIQVGYYLTGDSTETSGCTARAVEEYSYPSGPQFVDFQFPSSFGKIMGSKAYGINDYGQVVGSYTLQTTPDTTLEVGWEFSATTYTTLQFHQQSATQPNPNASPTTPHGISWSGSVVGSYQDSGGATHGFLQYYKGHVWSSEDFPSTGSRTVVYGTDDPAFLVGAYKTTGTGSWNGFYAVCNSMC